MQAKKQTSQIQYYQTNVGIFFKVIPISGYYSSALSGFGIISVDGVDVNTMISNNGWLHTTKGLKNFIKKVPGQSFVSHYRLLNESLASPVIPLIIPTNDLETEWDDDEDRFNWVGKHTSLESLYTPVYAQTEPTTEQVDDLFELVKIRDIEVDNWKKPEGLTVSWREGNFGGKEVVQDLSKIACVSDIEQMLTPEFLLHTRPCYLTSEQVYKIIRDHVIRNIDNKQAVITSNYDFCFTVKKRVKTKPFVVKKEKITPRGNSYKPPKFYNETQDSQQVECFEMTWDKADKGSGYRDYTVIQGWNGDNLQDLYNNIQAYLEDLMDMINTPWVHCECCNGTGMQQPKFELNKR